MIKNSGGNEKIFIKNNNKTIQLIIMYFKIIKIIK
jgi:hypothetical protein